MSKERTRTQPLICDWCEARFELAAVWSGNRTMTAEVVRIIHAMLVAAAVADGWHVDGGKHRCRACAPRRP